MVVYEERAADSYSYTISKVEDDHPSVPASVRQVPEVSESYRPCLMVADTSDQSQDCGASKKVRRPRTCFSDEQLKELERRFRINKYVSVADRTLLCSELGLTDSQIKTWFQNRRTKWKRLNEARYNLLSDGVDSRLLRKDSTYYAHPGVTIPSFQTKGSDPDITSSFTSPHNIYSSFSNSFHSFPNYMWSATGGYSPVYNPALQNPTPTLPATSTQLTPLTVLTPLQSSSQVHPATSALSSGLSNEDESSAQSQFHSLYPSSKLGAAAAAYQTSKAAVAAAEPPYSTKEGSICVAPYSSPYYSPCVDKSIRSQYQTALT
ncbi:homeobox protein ceh-31-like isoform X2 [Bolinopsis microptera]|uniref:homeobox protein ceh-31-like isoform X2 n=1 Tax=Bolinopsis microptera TaxID=2820187 RepID=UPI00307AFF89